jgi:hypothetical protein
MCRSPTLTAVRFPPVHLEFIIRGPLGLPISYAMSDFAPSFETFRISETIIRRALDANSSPIHRLYLFLDKQLHYFALPKPNAQHGAASLIPLAPALRV